VKKVIKSITIENSSLCGANCIMCLRDNTDYYYGVMPLNLFKKLIFDAVAMGIDCFLFGAFGDPLMDNFLEERFSFIKELNPNANISLTATAHLLNKKNAVLLCKYVNSVKISHYGFNKESYESVHRGNLKYEEAKQNIDFFLNLPKRPKTILTFLVLPENKKDLDDWKNYFEPKCDEIVIWKPHNWGGNKKHTVESISAPPSQCRRALELSNLVIRADGRVSLCCFDISNGLIVGDIKTQNLNSLINGEKIKKIQQVFIEKSVLESRLPCKNCDQIYDRRDALVYTNNPAMEVGKYSHLKI
jgi:radical SAM protein with 4Fe4S-binding SPASM domain